MIRLYAENETNFDNNGLAVLDADIKENTVEEKMNGIYEFDFAYLSSGKYANLLDGDMIVKTPTPDGDQLFRIIKVTKNIGYLEVNCYHIFYDLAGNFIEDINIVGQNGQDALDHMDTGMQYPTRFKFMSNMTQARNARMVRLNAVQALLDASQDNSFLSRWGGEIKRDNFTVLFNDVRGNDKGFKVQHGKNLTGYEAEIDYSTVVTKIMPYGYDGLMLPEKYVDSPLKNKYAFTRIKKIEYKDVKAIDPEATTTDEDAVPLEQAYAQLRAAASREYSVNKIDIPTSNFKITFKNLADTKEYADFKALEKALPWDYVTVVTPDFNIISRMISYQYDALTKQYKKIELGNYVPAFTDTTTSLNNQLNNVNDGLNNLTNDVNHVAKSADGKNSNYYGPDEPLSPVNGDLWYKKNGDKTELWQYDGKAVPPGWKLLVDDSTGEEVKQKVKEVGEETQQAINDANNAVANAGFAKDAAEKAKTDAANALERAVTAFEHADSINESLTAEIDTVNNSLDLKANKTDVNRIDGTVNNLQADIKLQADEISSKVSQNDVKGMLNGYATQNWTQSQVKQTADSINLTVSNVENKIDNLNFGYRNLIPNGSFNDGLNGWENTNPKAIYVRSEKRNSNSFVMFNGLNDAEMTGADYIGDLINTTKISLQPETEYTLRIITRSGIYNHYLSYLEERDKNGKVLNDHAFKVLQTDASVYSKNIQRFTTNTNAATGTFRVRLYPGDQFMAGEIILVQGNKLPQDWIAAPEDMATKTQFTSLEQTVEGIQVTANNAVTQTQLTALNDRFNVTVKSLTAANIVPEIGWSGAKEASHDFYKGGYRLYRLGNETTSENFAKSERFAIKPNQKYTLSFIGFAASNVASIDVFILGRQNGNTIDYDPAKIQLIVNKKRLSASNAERVEVTFTTHDIDEAYLRFDNNGSTNGKFAGLYFAEVQLEEGTKATSFKPVASQSMVDLTSDHALVSANKLYLDASTAVFSGKAFIPNAAIATLNADKITTGTLNASKVNIINLNAKTITTGTLRGANLSMNLNTGQVVFKKGYITSANGRIRFDLDRNYFQSLDISNNGFMAENGEFVWYQNFMANNKNEIGRIMYDVLAEGDAGMIVQGNTGVEMSTKSGKAAVALGMGGLSSKADGIKITGDPYIFGDLDVLGKKNAVHVTNDGLRETPAYETTESYLGDIGEAKTDTNGIANVEIDTIFQQIINTDYPYQVFITPYSKALFWVANREKNTFIVCSSAPNAKFAWEIKAKRRGYETDRLEKTDINYEQLNKAYTTKRS